MIKLYFASDDQLVSEDNSNPISVTLRSDLEESEAIRVYAQADAGFSVTGVTAQPTGSTLAKWALAPDTAGSAGTYEANGASLTLGTVGAGSGGRVHFWVRAEATNDETPTTDETVTIDLEGVAEAV